MSQKVIAKEQEVKIPTTLATRIRKIAPYGKNDSMDSYITYMLDEFVSQLEKSQPISQRYNPFTEKELEQVKEDIKCFSLYS
jgi:hypothetical protein